MLGYIRRFGFWRGIRFYRVARFCEGDPEKLRSWATHFRQKASACFLHDDLINGDAYLAWAEILQTTYEKMTGKKPARALLTGRTRKGAKKLKRLKANAS